LRRSFRSYWNAPTVALRRCEIADDEDTGETILEIEVRGKRGVGYCKTMPGAARPHANGH
jgi:hypothetical protein